MTYQSLKEKSYANEKKYILIAGSFCFLIGAIFFYLHNSTRKISEEAKPHLKKFYALSGELTPAQKQEYIETMAAIQAIHNQTPLPTEEAQQVLQHSYELSMSNPELLKVGGMIEDKAHGHAHEHRLTEEERIQKRLDAIDADIAHFEKHIADGDVSPENAANYLNFLRTIRRNTANPVLTELEYAQRLMEVRKTAPEVIGLKTNLLTREITNIYPNMITIRKRREHHPDGAVREVYTGNFSHFTDPKIQQDVEAYLDELRKLPPGAPPPPQPKHKGLRFQVVYKDSYPLATKEHDVTESLQPTTKEQEATRFDDSTPTIIEHAPSSEPILPAIEDSDVDTRYTDAEEFRRAIESLENPELEAEFWDFLESLTENPLPEANTDLESYFEDVFIPDTQFDDSWDKDLSNPIPKPKDFTPERFENAVRTLEEKGMRSLEKTDLDMAKYLKQLIDLKPKNR